MSIKKNMVYQMVYQTMVFGIPLLLSPYLTRTLGAESLGIFTYAHSIGYYFVIIAMLGIQNYGCRSIAQAPDNEKSRVFWEIYIAHALTSFFALFAYIVFLSFVGINKAVFAWVTLYVISALFDVTWFYYGIENFKTVIIRNVFVKVIELVLIFTLIQKQSDLVLYTQIECAIILIGQLVVIPDLYKRVGFTAPSIKQIFVHFKPLIVLSISVIATSIYASFDKTLLGMLSTNVSVAYYEYSEKIVKAPVQIIATVGTVMLPRASVLVANRQYNELKGYITRTVNWVGFASAAFIFMFFAVADEFSILYYGEEFGCCGRYIKLLCMLIVIITYGHIIRSQYLIPFGKDVEYVSSLVICGIINLILNLLLIPKWGVEGAIVATLLAEGTGCGIQIFFARKYIPAIKTPLIMIKYYLFGGVMYACINSLSNYLEMTVKTLVVKIIIGGIIYLVLNLIYVLCFDRELIIKFIRKMKIG